MGDKDWGKKLWGKRRKTWLYHLLAVEEKIKNWGGRGNHRGKEGR